jgi:hypothetical protein
MKDQLRQSNEKYMDLSREYRSVLEDQKTQYEQKTIDFLNIHGNLCRAIGCLFFSENFEGQVETLTSRYKQTILDKNKRIDHLENKITALQGKLSDAAAAEEISITKQSTTIAQLHFRVRIISVTASNELGIAIDGNNSRAAEEVGGYYWI